MKTNKSKQYIPRSVKCWKKLPCCTGIGYLVAHSYLMLMRPHASPEDT